MVRPYKIGSFSPVHYLQPCHSGHRCVCLICRRRCPVSQCYAWCHHQHRPVKTAANIFVAFLFFIYWIFFLLHPNFESKNPHQKLVGIDTYYVIALYKSGITCSVCPQSLPAPLPVARSARGTVSKIRSRDQAYDRTLRMTDLRRARRRYRHAGSDLPVCQA